jgi:hypothetical protein
MIASRHLSTLAALLACACVPTVVHSYFRASVDDARKVANLPLQLAGLEARAGRHSVEWVRDTYGTTDFIEREYGPNLTLFVARSYDAKGLYHHPENGVSHGDSYDRAVVVRASGRPDIPVFLLDNHRDRRSVYALLYDREFVEHPIRFQLQNAFTLLVRPRATMTLFFVREKNSATPSQAGSAGEALLLAAIDSFMLQPAK